MVASDEIYIQAIKAVLHALPRDQLETYALGQALAYKCLAQAIGTDKDGVTLSNTIPNLDGKAIEHVSYEVARRVKTYIDRRN